MTDLLVSPLTAGAVQTAPADPVAARFAHVDTWVFDLDNTLYPAGADLWPKIDARITVFMAHMLGLDGLSARALQKYYYLRYGTTLNGLMAEYGIGHKAYLDFVHDIDRANLPANPRLAQAIAALPGRRLILTNGSRQHAQDTARKLGIDHLFEDVFDIVAAELTPKPAAETYDQFFKSHRVEPTRAAMFEDIPRNLDVPAKRGMRTVLVVPAVGSIDHREAWERQSTQHPHVDVVTDSLEAFLESLLASNLFKASPNPL